MSTNLKITIITICKNSENTIARTIESVINQDYKNIEYIIIDGQSTDSTLEKIRNYKDTRIRLVSEADSGISDAFNKGIRLSTGELVGLINADDFLMPGVIRKIVEDYDGISDVVYGNTIVRDEVNSLTMLKKAGRPEQLKYEMPFIHQSSFVRKDTYVKCGEYSQDYGTCMDYDMMSRIRKWGGKFQYVEETVSCFSYGGTSCKHPFKTIFENLGIAKKNGLTKREYVLHATKLCLRNLLKIVLQEMGCYAFLYRLKSKKEVIDFS